MSNEPTIRHDKKFTRYTNGRVLYRNVSCRTSLYEYDMLKEYCRKNNISMSYMLGASAVYCIRNNIDPDVIYEAAKENK